MQGFRSTFNTNSRKPMLLFGLTTSWFTAVICTVPPSLACSFSAGDRTLMYRRWYSSRQESTACACGGLQSVSDAFDETKAFPAILKPNSESTLRIEVNKKNRQLQIELKNL